jgi:serine/threonine-protein kinase HipA
MSGRRMIEVHAGWAGLADTTLMGRLFAVPSRGKEVFSFEYDAGWLSSPHLQQLDPTLGLYPGQQYPSATRTNFGVFLDSCPDRWGRVLMDRREAYRARSEGRSERRLLESEYLLGVHDGHRMGALRFRTDGPFLDDATEFAAPPWTSLRELEDACLRIEQEDAEADPGYGRWLRMLIAPGGSLPAQVSADAGYCSEANIVATGSGWSTRTTQPGGRSTARQVRPTRRTRRAAHGRKRCVLPVWR